MLKTNIPTLEDIKASKETFVTVKNRFGREVDVSLYQARLMVKNGEGEIQRLDEEVTDEPNEELLLLESKLSEVTASLEKEVEEKTALVEKVSSLEKEVEEKTALVEKLKNDLAQLRNENTGETETKVKAK